MKKSALLLLFVLFLFSCGNQNDKTMDYSADELFAMKDSALLYANECSDTIEIKYAKGLKVNYESDGVHVIITNPDPKVPHAKKEEFVITKPSRRFICTTALQLGNFEVLGLEDKIVGMNSLRNLFSPVMKAQMENGKTLKIGKEGNFDLETVIACKPDYIFVSASKHGGFEALKECGIPLIPHHGYKETDPLGQAEWIKLIGLLTGETRRANAVFAEIEAKYIALREEVRQYISNERDSHAKADLSDGKADLTERDPSSSNGNKAEFRSKAAYKNKSAFANKATLPTIISGRQMRDGWYIAGGKSYMAKIFHDAGADYVMKDNEESGGVTLDFESVYAQGIHADFWQIDDSFNGEFSLADLAAEDERYATMDAFKNKHVLFCNLAQTPYRELAGVQPHLLLADYVKALHPEILPHYTPKYYKLLK